MTKKIEMVNIAQGCALLGVSRPTFMEYINRGMPVVKKGGKGQQWQLNPDSILVWKMTLDGTDMGGSDGGNPKGSYEAGRARKVNAEAAIKELALAKARGEAVSIDLVERQWATIFSNVKTRLLAIPSRLAPLIPSCGDSVVEIEAMLDKEVKAVLRALAESAHTPHDDIEKLANESDDTP